MKCKVFERALAIGLSISLMGMWPMEALAADKSEHISYKEHPLYGAVETDVNGFDASGKPVALTDTEWAQLNDMTIELSEIENLVHYKSVLGQSRMTSLTVSSQPVRDLIGAFDSSIQDIDDTIATLKDERSEADTQQEKDAYTAQIKRWETAKGTGSMLKTGLNSASKGLRTLKSTLNGMIYPNEKTMSAGMESMFYTIKSLEPTVVMLTKMRDTYQAAYDTAVRQQASGLGTALAVSEAKATLDGAQNQLNSLSETVRSLKTTLALSLGYSMTDAQNIILGDTLPEYDSTYAATRIFESDLATAKTNCYSYSQAWQTNRKSDASLTGYTAEDIDWNSQLQAIGMNMTNLYSDLRSTEQQVEAANLDFQIAEKQKGSAERSYAAGMIGYPQYLGAQIQYLNSKAAAATAKINALKAQNAYNWALRGVFS